MKTITIRTPHGAMSLDASFAKLRGITSGTFYNSDEAMEILAAHAAHQISILNQLIAVQRGDQDN